MKIRINDLARELEVKSKAILDVLEPLGITEKKTHSSSVEDDEAEKIRKHFSAKSAPASKEKAGPSEIKPKIDLSRISKPGDVLKLLREREQQQQHPPAAAKPAAVVPARPATAATAKPPAAPPPAPEPPASVTKPAVAETTVVVTPPVAQPLAPAATAPAAPPPAKPTAPPAVMGR